MFSIKNLLRCKDFNIFKNLQNYKKCQIRASESSGNFNDDIFWVWNKAKFPKSHQKIINLWVWGVIFVPNSEKVTSAKTIHWSDKDKTERFLVCMKFWLVCHQAFLHSKSENFLKKTKKKKNCSNMHGIVFQ